MSLCLLRVSLSGLLTAPDQGSLTTSGELFNISALDPLLPTLLIATLCLCALLTILYYSLVVAWEVFWASRRSPSPLDPSAEVVLTARQSGKKSGKPLQLLTRQCPPAMGLQFPTLQPTDQFFLLKVGASGRYSLPLSRSMAGFPTNGTTTTFATSLSLSISVSNLSYRSRTYRTSAVGSSTGSRSTRSALQFYLTLTRALSLTTRQLLLSTQTGSAPMHDSHRPRAPSCC